MITSPTATIPIMSYLHLQTMKLNANQPKATILKRTVQSEQIDTFIRLSMVYLWYAKAVGRSGQGDKTKAIELLMQFIAWSMANGMILPIIIILPP